MHHILVAQKFEAEDLLRKLAEGVSFEELAGKFSSCPSRARGGDLGEVAFGRADSDFEDEVARLKLDEVSQAPVRTKFGYHLIWRRA